MSFILWRGIPPQVEGSIAREDGRVCILQSIKEEIFADVKKKIRLPIPRVAYRMCCGDVLYSREVSLNVYYPAQVPDPPSCLKCIAARPVR